MVARKTHADAAHTGGIQGLARRFLYWWRGLLSLLVERTVASARTLRSRAEVRTTEPLRRPLVVWLGAIAILIGAIAGVALASPGTARESAVLGGVTAVIWALLRLLIMQLSARGALARDTAAIRGAWGLGSVVWLLGITPELRMLAWAVSGLLTGFALRRLGADGRQVRVCVGIAWGAQALVTVGIWLARNAIVAVLLSR